MSLDLQSVLAHLDQNDTAYYDSLRTRSDDLKELNKNVSWMIPQWMTGAYDGQQQKQLILMFDAICNPGWGSFYTHPELQAKLLSLIGLGKVTRHRFYRPTGRNPSATPELIELLREEYPDIRDNEVDLWCRDTDIEGLTDLMYRFGIPVEDHKKIITQYNRVRAA